MLSPDCNSPNQVDTLGKEDPRVIEAIEKVKGKEIEIAELYEIPAYSMIPKFMSLVNGAQRMIVLAKIELKQQDPRIAKSPFERPITTNSLRYVNNYLETIDKDLEEARSLIRDPRTIKSKDFNSEWLNTD
jgi:hypothetical protein